MKRRREGRGVPAYARVRRGNGDEGEGELDALRVASSSSGGGCGGRGGGGRGQRDDAVGEGVLDAHAHPQRPVAPSEPAGEVDGVLGEPARRPEGGCRRDRRQAGAAGVVRRKAVVPTGASRGTHIDGTRRQQHTDRPGRRGRANELEVLADAEEVPRRVDVPRGGGEEGLLLLGWGRGSDDDDERELKEPPPASHGAVHARGRRHRTLRVPNKRAGALPLGHGENKNVGTFEFPAPTINSRPSPTPPSPPHDDLTLQPADQQPHHPLCAEGMGAPSGPARLAKVRPLAPFPRPTFFNPSRFARAHPPADPTRCDSRRR
jgi:hypothetical protein